MSVCICMLLSLYGSGLAQTLLELICSNFYKTCTEGQNRCTKSRLKKLQKSNSIFAKNLYCFQKLYCLLLKKTELWSPSNGKSQNQGSRCKLPHYNAHFDVEQWKSVQWLRLGIVRKDRKIRNPMTFFCWCFLSRQNVFTPSRFEHMRNIENLQRNSPHYKITSWSV